MPSFQVWFNGASGFIPVFSGVPFVGWSGLPGLWGQGQSAKPIGSVLLRNDKSTSGNLYVSLSGAVGTGSMSGIVGILPGSGGPTVTSGVSPYSGAIGSGWGTMDGYVLAPGDCYQVPVLALRGASGPCQLCIGADPSVSGGFGRCWVEVF